MHRHRLRACVGTRVHAGPRRSGQRGFSLIEAVCALLIFSAGVLGIARLQSVAVQQTSAASYRTTAALLARNLIAAMWLSDRTHAALKANFDSTGSAPAGYTAWMGSVTAANLPGAATTAPTVSVAPVMGGGATPAASSTVVVTISWQAPGDRSVHSYVETAQIK